MNAVVMNSQRALERVEHILYRTINRIVRGTEHNSMTSYDNQGDHEDIVV